VEVNFDRTKLPTSKLRGALVKSLKTTALSQAYRQPRSTGPERYSFSAEKFARKIANAVNIKVSKVLPQQYLFLALSHPEKR
jgi:hypothetical protein